MMKCLLMSLSVIGLFITEGEASVELWQMEMDGVPPQRDRQSPLRKSPSNRDASDAEEETNEREEDERFPIQGFQSRSLPQAIPGGMKRPQDPLDIANSVSFILGSSPPMGEKSLSGSPQKKVDLYGLKSQVTERGGIVTINNGSLRTVIGWKIEPPKK